MAIENHICQIKQAGASVYNDGNTPQPMVLFLMNSVPSDPGGTFGDTWFYAAPTAKNQLLAVALAAMSTQSTVNAFVDTPSGPGDKQCYNMYLMAP